MPNRRYTLEGRLGFVKARGAQLKGPVAERVISAELSLSTNEVTQLTLALTDDADFSILNSRLFDAGSPTRKGSHLSYGPLMFECRAVEIAPRGTDHVLTVTARSAGASKLKRAYGPLIRRNISPADFVALEAKKVGLKFVGQQTGNRRAISRQHGNQQRESSWDTIQRLAQELGFIAFESYGTLYFGQPTWLVDQRADVTLAWKGKHTGRELDALPDCRRSGDNPHSQATVDVTIRGEPAARIRPGMGLVLSGVPTFAGKYLVTDVTVPLAEHQPVTATAITPLDPDPEEANITGALDDGSNVHIPSLKGLTVKGAPATRVQIANAVAIFRTGAAMGIDLYGIRVAITTGITESTLHNYPGGDRDSVGVFQQRASWGPYSVRHDPAAAARLFYRALRKVPDWHNLTINDACQAVQHSGTPNAYGQWAGEATKIAKAIAKTANSNAPQRGSRLADDFVKFCLAQAGDNYVFGHEVNLKDPNPNTFDCSELVQWAAYQVGLHNFPDGSWNQAAVVLRTSIADAIKIRGALLFQGARGVTHVAVSLGNGKTIEAADEALGVCSLNAAGRPWTIAGVIPGLTYDTTPRTGPGRRPTL